MAPYGARPEASHRGLGRVVNMVPWSFLAILLQLTCGMVLSLSGQALDLHSSVIFSVVLGRWASPVPLTHVFTVPVWSITAFVFTAWLGRGLPWYRLSVLYVLPTLHALEVAKGSSWAFDPVAHRFHYGFVVLLVTAAIAMVNIHTTFFWNTLQPAGCQDPLMSVDWEAVLASTAPPTTDTPSESVMPKVWGLSSTGRGPVSSIGLPATLGSSSCAPGWASLYTQAHARGLFNNVMVPPPAAASSMGAPHHPSSSSSGSGTGASTAGPTIAPSAAPAPVSPLTAPAPATSSITSSVAELTTTAAAAPAHGGVSDDNRQATRLVFTDPPKFAIIDAAPAAAKLTDKAASTTSGAVIKAAEGSPTKHAEASPIKPDNAAMPVEDTRSIPAVKTDSRTETSPGSKAPPSTKAKKTTNTSTAAKQPLEENTQAATAQGQSNLKRQGSSMKGRLQKVRSDLQELQEKVKLKTTRRGRQNRGAAVSHQHPNHATPTQEMTSTSTNLTRGDSLKEKLKRKFSPRHLRGEQKEAIA